jgi:hypothetical protein
MRCRCNKTLDRLKRIELDQGTLEIVIDEKVVLPLDQPAAVYGIHKGPICQSRADEQIIYLEMTIRD